MTKGQMEQIDTNHLILMLAAALVVAGVLSNLIASRFGAPLLLLFLVIGMLVGEDGPGGLRFDNFALVHLVGAAALAIILFDGGLRTKARSLRGVLAPAGLLATFGVLATAAIVAVAAMLLLRTNFVEGLLIGAIVASTDAAAVFFLVRTGGLRLKRRVNDTLEIESSTNDPFAIFLVLALVAYLRPGGAVGHPAVLLFFEHMLLGLIMGAGGGLLLSMLLNRTNFPTGLAAVLVAGSALVVFGTTAVSGGSGFLAVYVAGIVVGNRPTRMVTGVTTVTDAATWLAQLVMFTLLGILASPHRLLDVVLPALGIAFVLILIARPAAVVLCLLPFRFRWTEKAFVAWVGLRGAVAIFLAAVPVLAELPNALRYFDIAFFVVLVSLVVQGWTVRPAAKLLGMALPGADHPESRTELDLPGRLDQELVGYPVQSESAYLAHQRLPAWAKLVMVVRDEAILLPAEAGPVRSGDYVYLLAPPMQAARLDRLFAETAVERSEGEIYFGEFALPALTRMSEIAALYAAETKAPDHSAAEAFVRAVGTPVVGDTLRLGEIELVAKVVEEGKVVEIGIRLEPEPVADRLQRLARRIGLKRPPPPTPPSQAT
jgi:cell volume regulation protein A